MDTTKATIISIHHKGMDRKHRKEEALTIKNAKINYQELEDILEALREQSLETFV